LGSTTLAPAGRVAVGIAVATNAAALNLRFYAHGDLPAFAQ
jgi:hypothetical protein